MDGRDLLQALMNKASPPWNPNSLAVRVGTRSRQPQIHRFLKGDLIEPRRETLRPVADFFGVPLDAFYDAEIAERVAMERGLQPRDGTSAASTAPPIPLPPRSVKATLEQLAQLARPHRPALRKSLAMMVSELLENPDQPGLLEQTIQDVERIFGAAGSGEIPPMQPSSTRRAA